MEQVILVDKNDKEIGREEKLETHKKGKLHRAFSIFIFNSRNKLLLQQRAKTKYHSPGLWSNSCCSHPRPEESLEKATRRRLKEEMGIECPLKEIFSFIYKAKVEDLIENEFDHVFVGRFNGEPKINKDEVMDWKWISINELKKDIKENPQEYTPWFGIIIKSVLTLDLEEGKLP